MADPTWPRGGCGILTGATGGIGQAVAEDLARVGMRLLVTGRREADLARLAKRLSMPMMVADLSDPSTAQGLVDRAIDEFGRLDVVVANAGIGWSGYLADMGAEAMSGVIKINLESPLALAAAAAPHLGRSPRSSMVFVSSIAGHLGVPGEAVYSAAKAGLVVAAQALRQELASQHTAVSVVSPGVVDTDFFANHGTAWDGHFPPPLSAKRVAKAVTKAIRTGRPESIVPPWLRVAAVVRAVSPTLYTSLATRISPSGLALAPGVTPDPPPHTQPRLD